MVAKPLQRVVLALLAFVVIGGSSPSQAQSSSSKVKSLQAKKKTNKAAIKDIESQLRETKQQQRSASARLYAAQRKLSSAEDDLAATRAKLRAAKDRLEASREELARVEAELKKAIDLFWDRMAIFYKQGSLGYVEVALGAADFEQFVDRGILLKKIAEHDLELRAQIELERARREALVATVTANVTELRSVRDEHQSALDTILAQRAEQDGIYTELRETQREISRTLSRLLNPPSANGVRSYGGNPNFAGGFARPVNGRVTSTFGWRRHPILGTRRFHNGVDFAAPSGTTIRAAAAGTVVSSGWMRAYGKTVMINHGNGYVSMYAHSSSLLVSNGASVSQGQAIARVGSTGLSTGAHLHFTIYRNGTEINPLR